MPQHDVSIFDEFTCLCSFTEVSKSQIGRRVKQVPRAFYKALPTSLFSEFDFPGWSFEVLKSNEEKVVLADENLNDEVDETNSNHEFNQESAKRQKINSAGR